MRRWTAVVAAGLLAGCAGDAGPTEASVTATDDSMPGVVVQVHVRADQASVVVEATAWNNGTRTWTLPDSCQSRWRVRLEGQGDEPSWVCPAVVVPPEPWGPGEASEWRMDVDRDEWGWTDQEARVVVTFVAYEGSIEAGAPLRLP